mmetsp:Transcript_44583/g.96915  ORF Transcript_44583/g.96915 Transcript_44583/m.96915 type:complete len:335 (-) Transcript_44583:100-1104(-)
MSTHACFEWHKKEALRHEGCAGALLQDAKAKADSPLKAEVAATLGGSPGSKKAVRLAVAQLRLALREHREAARLRPRDAGTRQRIAEAVKVLRSLQAVLAEPQPQCLRRFVAHYNLSIRYWDLGKAGEAVKEATRACDELRKAGLPCGCAEHNLAVMSQLIAEHRSKEKQLQAAIQRSPEAVGPNYELGILYFDKRMLLRAEAQLKFARERARALGSLSLVERDRQRLQNPEDPFSALASTKKAGRIASVLEDLDDDLEFLAGLRERWCVEDEAGKVEELQETGVRDGVRPRLLPCLRRRFEREPLCEACDGWWIEICGRQGFSSSRRSPKKVE